MHRLVTVLGSTVALAQLGDLAAAQSPLSRVDVRSDGTVAFNALEWDPHPVSADGRWIAFTHGDDGFVPGDSNGTDDVFARDLASGAIVRVSVSSAGEEGNAQSFQPAISGDGRFVAFASAASNLVAGDTGGWIDVFLHDRDPDADGVFDEANATTIRLSQRSDGITTSGHSEHPSIAADGSYVAFDSDAELDFVNRSGIQVFGFDVASGTLECLSIGWDGGEPGGDAKRPAVSADGNRVAFQCSGPWVVATDLNSSTDIFVRDRGAWVSTLVSVTSAGEQADDDSFECAISADGMVISFTSDAQNLADDDVNQAADVYLRDLVASTTELASRATDGTPGDRESFRSAISGDGRFLAFESRAWNFDPDDGNQVFDVFLLDRASGVLELVSETCFGQAGNKESTKPSVSADGRIVSYFSRASDLLPDEIGGDHVYLRDRAVDWIAGSHRAFGAGWPGTLGIPALDAVGEPAFGASFDVTVSNSSGAWNVGFLFLGFDEASIPTSLGGTLLVTPDFLLAIALPPFGWTASTSVPLDASYYGAELYVQVIQLDSGASHGCSFTPGLELIFGR